MSLIANTGLGRLRGVEHRGAVQFRGVPYARPPVGTLRFRPPVPPAPWAGVRDATAHGPIAPQGPSRLRVAVGDFTRPQSEDCLTLTITTPSADDRRRPVIVWLHGGGYGSGAGSLDWYDGAALAVEGDVVVVGVNYRLGPLGYLCHAGTGDGRMGLDDMIAAIRWVAAHIGAFGGDPGEITLMGQSAGAHSTLIMLTMPDVRRLFRRAILQSAPAGVPPLSGEQATEWARRYLAVLGQRPLRSVEPEVLLHAAATLARNTARLGQVEPPFLPVADDLSDVEAFLGAAARGAAEGGVAVVVGTNRDEARAMVAADPRAQAATPEDVEAYRQRVGVSTGTLAEAMTEAMFVRPSTRFATAAREAGANVWTYQLDWAPAGSPLGVCHCLELPLVFHTDQAWADAPMLGSTPPGHVARLIRANWLHFARHGRPEPGWTTTTMRFQEGTPR